MKNFENGGNIKNFLESCNKKSKLSVDDFEGLRSHLVAQKFDSEFFSSKMTLTSNYPHPLLTCVNVHFLIPILFAGKTPPLKRPPIQNGKTEILGQGM